MFPVPLSMQKVGVQPFFGRFSRENPDLQNRRAARTRVKP